MSRNWAESIQNSDAHVDISRGILTRFNMELIDAESIKNGYCLFTGIIISCWQNTCNCFENLFLILLIISSTVKFGDKEQIGVKEPFPVANCKFTSSG